MLEYSRTSARAHVTAAEGRRESQQQQQQLVADTLLLHTHKLKAIIRLPILSLSLSYLIRCSGPRQAASWSSYVCKTHVFLKFTTLKPHILLTDTYNLLKFSVFVLFKILWQVLFHSAIAACAQSTMHKILIVIKEKRFSVHPPKLHQSYRIHHGCENCVHCGVHNCLHLNLSGIAFSLSKIGRKNWKWMNCLGDTQTQMTHTNKYPILWQCPPKRHHDNDIPPTMMPRRFQQTFCKMKIAIKKWLARKSCTLELLRYLLIKW